MPKKKKRKVNTRIAGGRKVRSTKQTAHSMSNISDIRSRVYDQVNNIVENYDPKFTNLADAGTITDNIDDTILIKRLRYSPVLLNWIVNAVRKRLNYYEHEPETRGYEYKMEYRKSKKQPKYKLLSKRKKVKKKPVKKFRVGLIYFPMHVKTKSHNMIMITGITKTGVKFKTMFSTPEQKKVTTYNNKQSFLSRSKVEYSASNVVNSKMFRGTANERRNTLKSFYTEFKKGKSF